MPKITIEGRPVSVENSNGPDNFLSVSGHLYLVYTADNGVEYVIRGGPQFMDPIGGILNTQNRNMGAPDGFLLSESTDARFPDQLPEDRGAIELDLNGREATDVWELMEQQATNIAHHGFPYVAYNAFGDFHNSNGLIGELLRLVGIDVAAYLPDIPNHVMLLSYAGYDQQFVFDYTIEGTARADTIMGGAGSQTLRGNGGADKLYGGDDNDVLIAASGADILDGGDGVDLADLSQSMAPRTFTVDTNGVVSFEAADSSVRTRLESIERVKSGAGNDTILLSDQSLDLMEVDLGGGTNTVDGSNLSSGLVLKATDQRTIDGLIARLVGGVLVAGAQKVVGSAHADQIDGMDGLADTILGGDGADELDGRSGNDRIEGGDKNDTIRGGSGNDALFGGADNDLFFMGPSSDDEDAGADAVDGGTGHDVASFEDMRHAIVFNDWAIVRSTGPNTTLTGIEKVIGTAYADNVYSWRATLNFEGAGGNDIIRGGQGADTLSGGDGDDFLYGYRNDTTGTNLTKSHAVGKTLRGDAGNDRIFGSNAADSINGGADNDYLHGNSGNDTIDGTIGADTVYGGAGNDYIGAGSLTAFVDGGDGTDTISFLKADSALVLNARIGTSSVSGGATCTLLNVENFNGSAHADQISWGGKGVVDGGAGDDRIIALDGSGTTVRGGDGNDFLDCRQADPYARYTIDGGNGNDIIYGVGAGVLNNSTPNTITGGMGNDTIYNRSGSTKGDAGNDILFIGGGLGTGDVWGGEGSDTFRFTVGSTCGDQTIHDYEAGEKIYVSKGHLITSGSGYVQPVHVGNDTYLATDIRAWDYGITVKNAHLSMSDFILV